MGRDKLHYLHGASLFLTEYPALVLFFESVTPRRLAAAGLFVVTRSGKIIAFN